jgi:hypothetical protein
MRETSYFLLVDRRRRRITYVIGKEKSKRKR